MTNIFKRFIRSKGGITFVQRKLKEQRERQEAIAAIQNRIKNAHGQPIIYFEKALEVTRILGSKAYMNDLEVPVLSKMAMQATDTIVEIGAAFGASSLLFCAHAPQNIEVHSIDPFVKDSMGDFMATEKKCHDNVVQGLTTIGMPEKAKRWTIHPFASTEVVKTWTKPIGLLFIDGDHHYEAVKKDFEDWFPKVNTGGYIMIHDSQKIPGTPENTFNQGWAGPTKLANELNQRSDIKRINSAFSLTVWQKQ